MTVALQTVENNLRTAILGAGTNTRVIFIAPNAPRPELPYTCVEYVATQDHPFDYTAFDTDAELDRLYGHRVLLFTITTYGENALDEANMLNSIVSGFQSFSILLNQSEEVSLAVGDITAVDYQYVLRDDTYEKTAFFDIILNVVMEDGSTTQDLGFFTEVSEPESNIGT